MWEIVKVMVQGLVRVLHQEATASWGCFSRQKNVILKGDSDPGCQQPFATQIASGPRSGYSPGSSSLSCQAGQPLTLSDFVIESLFVVWVVCQMVVD